MTGEGDRLGEINRVSGSRDVSRSAPVLTGILTGKELEMLGGVFQISDLQLRADIESQGRIHIKSKSGIEHLSEEGRVISAVMFLSAFCELYATWIELDQTNRYPPAGFFEKIYKNLEEVGVGFNQSIEPVLERYKDKRGE